MRTWKILLLILVSLWLSSGSCHVAKRQDEAPPAIEAMYPIAGPVAAALQSSRRGGGRKGQGFDSTTVEAILISDAIYVPETRQSALDTLFERWGRDLTNISWIDVAFIRRPLFRSRTEFERYLETPELSDTNTAVGLYVKGRIDGRRSEEDRTTIRALEFADALPPVQRQKLFVKAADAISRTGETERAIEFMLDQLPVAAQLGGAPLEARIWDQLGSCLFRADRIGEAIRCRGRGAELFGSAGVLRKRLADYTSIAEYLVVDGKIREAYETFEWVVRQGRRHQLPHATTTAMQNLGFLLSDAGENRLALGYQWEVLETVLAAQDSAHVARRYLNVADEYLLLGQMDSLKIMLHQAKRWTEIFPKRSIRWSVFIDESDYWLLEGDFERADSLRMLADSLAQGYADPSETAMRHLKVADHGREMGRISQSHAALQQLRALMDSGMISNSLQDVDFHYHRSMSALQLDLGETRAALEHIKLCGEQLRLRPSPERSAQYWLEKARFAALGADSSGAAAAYDSALSWALASQLPLRINRSRLAFADWLLASGAPEAALAQVEAIASPFGQSPSSRSAQLSRQMLGRIALARRDPGKAKEILAGLNADSPGNLPADLRIETLLLLAECEAAQSQWRRSQSLLERAIQLLHEQQSRAGGSEIRREQGDNLRLAFTRRIRLLLAHPELLDGSDPALATLALRLELEEALWGKAPGPVLNPGMRPALAVLLDEEESYLWIVRGGGVTLNFLPGRDAINQAVRSLINSIDVAGRQRTDRSADDLAAWFLSPLSGSWRPGQTLGVLPDRGLHGLPWATLPWEGRYVLDHAPVVELTDLRHWDGADLGSIREGRLLAIGYDGERLEHAEAEARELALLWPGEAQVIVGASALGQFRKQVAANSYTAIHLAVHADVGMGNIEHPVMRLGTDEPGALPLTPLSIQKLALDSEFVFLSCCQGSRGPNGSADAVLDLARAFTEGGCRSVITSSRRIQDLAAKQLALRFYRALRDGVSPAEALRSAQISLRDDDSGIWLHPYFWGHYHVLIDAD